MRKRYTLHIINSSRRWGARSLSDAIGLAVQHVHAGETWRITVTIGRGDPHVVHAGVGRRDLDAYAGLVDEAAG